MDKYLFIGGMPRCGTSALASWLIGQELAENLVDDAQAPALYTRDDFKSVPRAADSGRGLWRLNASSIYALNPHAIERMPKQSAKIILCFRNPWERAWSQYKVLKTQAAKEPERELSELDAEGRRQLLEGDFFARVTYELSFLYSYRRLPSLSILAGGRYNIALNNVTGGNVFKKFPGQAVFPVSIHRLLIPNVRRHFVNKVLGVDRPTEQVERAASSQTLDIGEPKPEFADAKFNPLRSSFAYDLRLLVEQLRRSALPLDFFDFTSLRRNVL